LSKNYYPEMMDIIKADWPVNKVAVFDWMCKHRPHSIIEAIKATSDTVSPKFNEPDYVEECRVLIRGGKVIAAIKHWREKAGDSLVQAKNAIENLRNAMQK